MLKPKIKVYPLSDSAFTSQIYAGVFELAALSEIELEFIWRPLVKIHERKWGNKTNKRIAYLELWEDQKQPIKICYDMLDGPAVISLDGLEKCDVYFKRSYSPEFLKSKPDIWQNENPQWIEKIRPYGLYYGCDSEYEFAKFRRSLIYSVETGRYYQAPVEFILSLSKPQKVLRSLALSLLRKNQSKRPMIEIPPEETAESSILFQTRLFNPQHHHPHSEETARLNEYRIEVMRALKNTFGKRLVGGLVPNEYAKKHCSDLLTTESISRKKYLELVRKSKVVIFTRGIRQSTGFRFPEYLACSRCIVSEPLEYELPNPLQEEKNYLLFNSPDECIEACEKILADEKFAYQMRVNNFEYYNRYVKASSIIRNTLHTARAIRDSKKTIDSNIKASHYVV